MLMRFVRALAAICILAAATIGYYPTNARLLHGSAPLIVLGAKSIQNLAGGSGYPYINFLKRASGPGFTAPMNQSLMNADGYPLNTASLPGNVFHGVSLPPSSVYSGNWVLGWTGTCSVNIDAGSTTVVGSPTGGITVVSHTGNFITTGSTGSVTFNWPAGTPQGTIAFYFFGTGAFTNCAGMYLVRADQLTAFQGGSVFSPEYLSWLTTLNPKVLRFMDWGNTNNSNVATYTYRPPVTAFAYADDQYPPGALSTAANNAIAGTDAYTIPGYADCPSTCTGAYQDGETFSGIFTNANTTATYSGTQDNGAGLTQLTGIASTTGFVNGASITTSTGIYTAANVTAHTIDVVGLTYTGSSSSGSVNVTATMNINGRGAKQIVYGGFAPPVGNVITASEFATFSYNANLDQFYMTPNGGISYGAPYEIFVTLANLVNADIWICVPAMLNDASLSSMVAYVSANLNAGHELHLEWANEIWNGETQTYYSYVAGMAAGYPLVLNSYFLRTIIGNTFYGNEVLRLASLAPSAWSPRSASQLNIELANQGQSLPLSVPSVQSRFNGWYGGTRYAITGITNSNTGAVVTVPTHTFSPGDKVFIGGQINNWYDNAPTNFLPTCGMTEIDQPALGNGNNNSPYVVHAVAGSNITLYDWTNTNPIDSSGWGTWASSGQNKTITTAPTSGQSLWTISGGHHFAVGDRVQFTGGTLPAGFFQNITYYISDVGFSATQFELTTKQVGLNGSIVTATGSGSGTITIKQVQCSGGQVYVVPTTPNAPASKAQYLSEANYFNGGQFQGPGSNPSVMSPYNVGIMSGAGQLFNQAYNYVNGNPTQQAAALAFMDNDTRYGLLPPNPVTSNCPNAAATFTLPMPGNFYATNGFGYSNGQMVQLSGTLPTGFSANTNYLLINANVGAGTFQLDTLPTPTGTPLGCSGAGGSLSVVSADAGAPLAAFSGPSLSGGIYTPLYQQWGAQATAWGAKGISNYEGGMQDAPPSGATLLTPTAGSFVGKIDNGSGGAGNTLTVTAVGEGFLAVGQSLNYAGGPGTQTITAYGTGTGNTGTYTISGTAVNVATTNMQSVGDYYNPPYAYGGDVTITTPATTAACTWSTSTPHNLVAGNTVILSTTNTLPAPFLTYTNYYVVSTNLTSTNFCLSATQGGSPITPTSNGVGTQTFSEDAGDLFALLTAYKNSALFKQTVLDQISQFQSGTGGTGNIWGWYGDLGANVPGSSYGSPWALCPSDEYTACFKSYDAIQQYNFLLKRDLNPKTNDNDPMWLEKAA